MEVHKEDVTDKILSTKVKGGGEREKERERDQHAFPCSSS